MYLMKKYNIIIRVRFHTAMQQLQQLDWELIDEY